MKFSYLLGLSLFLSSFAAADSPRLGLTLPVDCEIGSDCQIQNFFDHDSGPGFRDYHCGVLGYDGHKGTDIRLPNLMDMKRGVSVLAAADGRVRAIRNDEPDISIREPGRLEAISGKEAGNAVAITHGNGWETQYSHLRRGSVRVKPGQLVKAGETLGLVGLSGRSEFPHLHFEVRYHGKPVDPFIGPGELKGCGLGDVPLWEEQVLAVLEYQTTGLLQSGFSDTRPELARVEAGEYRTTQLEVTAPALVFWIELFGAQKGDLESMNIQAPDGSTLVKKERTLRKNKAQWFSFAGKKRREQTWLPGTYRAHYRLTREREGASENIIEISRELQLR